MRFILEVEIPDEDFDMEYFERFKEIKDDLCGWGDVIKCQLKGLPDPLEF